MSLWISVTVEQPVEVFSANITHNLMNMAMEAGCYRAIWRPEELGITTCAEALPYLREGLKNLISDPRRYKRLNPTNGWGSYESLIDAIGNYIAICEKYPNGKVSTNK
jgi:hypothetical protein